MLANIEILRVIRSEIIVTSRASRTNRVIASIMDMDIFMMTHPRPLYMERIEKLALKRSR